MHLECGRPKTLKKINDNDKTLTLIRQDSGGAGSEGVRPGSVQTSTRWETPRGGVLFSVDAPRSLPHGGDALHHRQLSVFLQQRRGTLHTAHTPQWGNGKREACMDQFYIYIKSESMFVTV